MAELSDKFVLHRIRPREAKLDVSYDHLGSSETFFTTFYEDRERRRLAGVSEYGPGIIEVSFLTYDEVLFVLEGEATVEPRDGDPFEMSAGDAIYFVKGTVTKWHVREAVRDLWCVVGDSPLHEEWRSWFPEGSSHRGAGSEGA